MWLVDTNSQSENRIKGRQIIVLIVCWFAYTSVYIGRQNLSVASPLMEASGIISKQGIGVLGSLFFFVYAFGRMINGFMGDKVEPKLMLGFGLMGAALCNIGMSFGLSVPFMYILWAINGYTQSMLWSAAIRVVAASFSVRRQRENAAMILSSSIGMGGIIAIIVSTLVSGLGYNMVFRLPGIIMFAISMTVLLFLPRTKAIRDQSTNPPAFSILLDARLLKMLFPAIAHGMIKDNLNLWMVVYFIDTYAKDISSAAFYIFLIPVSTLIGRIVFPLLYRLMKNNEKNVSITAFAACALVIIPLICFKLPIALAAVLLCLVAITTSIINAAFLSIFPLRFQESGQVSTVSGIIDFVTYMGSAVGSVMFGILIAKFGFGAMFNVWIIFAIISIVMLVISLKKHGSFIRS